MTLEERLQQMLGRLLWENLVLAQRMEDASILSGGSPAPPKEKGREDP